MITSIRWMVVVGLLVAGQWPVAAAAMYVGAADLARNCLGEKPQEASACLNYIAGVIDYHTVMQSLGTTPTVDFCLPADLKIEDAAYVVLSYMQSAPQNDDFIAPPTIILAMSSAYPCAAAAKGKK